MSALAPALGVLVALAWPVRALVARSGATAHAPRAAILLWQSVLLAGALTLIGALVLVALPGAPRGRLAVLCGVAGALAGSPARGPLTPNELFALTAALIVTVLVGGSLVVRALEGSRTRAHQRELIGLVATRDAALPGALVVAHRQPFAYCVGGLRARIVVSSGALEVLAADELAAVVAHERAHAHAHHDLALLPFRALASLLPGSRVLAGVLEAVTGLVEMAADDAAIRRFGPDALARALCRLTTAEVPSPALGAARGPVATRVERALSPRRSSAGAAFALLATATVVLVLPLVGLLGFGA